MYNPGPEASHFTSQAVKRYFQKKFPYRSTRQYSWVEEQELKHRYKKWKAISVLMVVLSLFGLMLLAGCIFHPLYVWCYKLLLPKHEIFFPQTFFVFVMLNGIPFSIATLMLVMEGSQRLFMGNDYKEFEDFYNNDQGYDNHKAGLFLTKIGLIIFAVTLPLTMSGRIIVRERTVLMKTFLSLTANEYKYDDTKRITYYLGSEYRNGNSSKDIHYRIFFYRWQ